MMTINVYDRDDVVRSILTVATSTGNVDPSPLAFAFWAVTASSTTVTTYVFGTNSELVQDSTGAYHVDVYANVEGTWQYEWRSTAGLFRGAQRGQWRIVDDVFST